MSNEANIWQPRKILEISGDTKSVEELIVAQANQTVFELESFSYALNTGALEIHKNGLLLIKNVDWVEQTSMSFSTVVPCSAGDKIVATGHVAITGEVVTADVDIYVANAQALRDYTGVNTTLYMQGGLVRGDTKESMFSKTPVAAAPGTYVDNGTSVIVPTGGDGSIAWIKESKLTRFNFHEYTVVWFDTVEDLVLGVLPNGQSVDFANIAAVGGKLAVKANNSTSGKGPAFYDCMSLSAATDAGHVIDGTGAPNYYGGNHAVGDGTYVAILSGNEARASQFGFTGSGDETTQFKLFFAFTGILNKNLDMSFSVSGVCKTADGTRMYRTNNAAITIVGDVTTDPTKSGANQGQAIEIGNDCVLTGIKMDGASFQGAGILNDQKSGSTVQLCEIDNNSRQAIHDYFGNNSKYIGNTLSRCLHGIQMWRTDGAIVSGNHVYQVFGGIWTAVATEVSVYGNRVHDIEDVGIDFEGGNRCYAWGNQLRACARGALTIFPTGPELVALGIRMGDLGFYNNAIVHQATFLNRLGVVTDNDLNNTGAMMFYGMDATTQGPIFWNGNTVYVDTDTAVNPGSMRAIAGEAASNAVNGDWVCFENNTIYTKFRSALRLQELRKLRFSGNKIHFIGVTQTSFDEIKDQHQGIIENNTVHFDDDCTPFSPTWKITNDKAMDDSLILSKNDFYNGAATALDITQTVISRVILKENKLAPERGSVTGGLTITNGLIQPINQTLVYSIANGSSLDLAAATGFYKSRAIAEGWVAAAVGSVNGAVYRLIAQTSDIIANCELASLDGTGAAGGQFVDANRYVNISGTTITPAGASNPTALVKLTLNERTAA